MELHLPRGKRRIELYPEVLIQHGLPIRFFPAALFPRGQPKLRKSVLQILTVRIECNTRALRHGAERHQCRCQLHAVVRCLGSAAAPLLDGPCRRGLNDGSPAARTARIAKARAIRMDDIVCIGDSGLRRLRSRTCMLRPCFRSAEPRPRLLLRHKALVDGPLNPLHLRRTLRPDGIEPWFSPTFYGVELLCHQ